MIVLLLTFYMVSWNAIYSNPKRAAALEFANETKWVAKLLRIDQKWNMFAPKPPTRSVRFEVIGRTASGQEIDLWNMRGDREKASTWS